MSRNARKPLTKSLRFERLETRTLLAGNVLATLDDHTLTITGDAGDNNIVITQTAKKDFTISADDPAGADRTKINGLSSQSFSRVKRIHVFMLGGVDKVTVHGDRLRKMDIDLGAGDDTLSITANRMKKTNITTGEGNDTATINSGRFKRTNVNMGAGADALNFTSAVPKRGTLDGGEGDDTLNSPNTKLSGNTSTTGEHHHHRLSIFNFEHFGAPTAS
jgi:hypothetical protein